MRDLHLHLAISSVDTTVFGTLLNILKPLLAMSVAFWHAQLRRRSDHQYELEVAATLIRIIGKVRAIVSPASGKILIRAQSKVFPLPMRSVHAVVKRLPAEAIRDVSWRCLDEMMILESLNAFGNVPGISDAQKKQLLQDSVSKREHNLTSLQRILMENYSVVSAETALFYPDSIDGPS